MISTQSLAEVKSASSRTKMQQGVLLPHEWFAALYNFKGGELFPHLLLGAPGDSCQRQCAQTHTLHTHMRSSANKDIEHWWSRNADLAEAHPEISKVGQHQSACLRHSDLLGLQPVPSLCAGSNLWRRR